MPANFCIIESRETVQVRKAACAFRRPAFGGSRSDPPAYPGSQDFAALQLDEIQDSITVRRNRIFLLMEEVCPESRQPYPALYRLTLRSPQVRRLRIQQRVKTGAIMEEDMTKQEFKSALPLLPPLVRKTHARRSKAGPCCSQTHASDARPPCADGDEHPGLLHLVHYPCACAHLLWRIHRAHGRGQAGPRVRPSRSQGAATVT